MKYFVRILAVVVPFLTMPLMLEAAVVYKWVDENGEVHYSDQPNNTTAQQVPLQAAPPPDPNAQKRQEQSGKWLKIREEERQLKAEEAAKAKQHEEERQQQCLQAKVQLKNYDRARYLYKPEEGDKEIILSDNERKAATEELKESIESLCS